MRLTKNPTRTRLRRLCPERPRAVLAREGAAISGPPPFPAGILAPSPSRLWSSSGGPPGRGPVGALEVRPGRLPDAAARDQDEVSGRAVRPAPVHLAQETFGPGPADGAPNLPAGHHAKPRQPASAVLSPDGHEVRRNAALAGSHHRSELDGPRNPLIPRKRFVPAGVRRLRAPPLHAILTHDDLSAAKGFRWRQQEHTVSAHRTADRRLGRQPSAAPATPAGDDRAAARSAHPCPETVLPLPPPLIGLKRPFHGIVLSKSLNLKEKSGGRSRCRSAAPPNPAVYRQRVFRVKSVSVSP